MLTEQDLFNAAYWASKDPEIAALRDIQDVNARMSAASQLVLSKGLLIDKFIDILGFDPFQAMSIWKAAGYTWVPAFLVGTTVQIAPGLTEPGLTPYNPGKPYPSGSIVVSTDTADYPPFYPAPPVPAPPPPTTDFVGSYNYTDPHTGLADYNALPGDPTQNGVIVTDSGGSFQKHIVLTPFGQSTWYTKIS